ncbi:MAG TPA: hypothetical protein VGN83_07510, partial [Falsiroseomonas sp.]|nr:hypothetical protein [Falsiroseomonas sp.]
MGMSYWRFAAMIATSTVVMYGLMYLIDPAWVVLKASGMVPGRRHEACGHAQAAGGGARGAAKAGDWAPAGW